MKKLLIILAFLPSVALGQAIGRDAKIINCKAPQSYAESDDCVAFEFEKSDKKFRVCL